MYVKVEQEKARRSSSSDGGKLEKCLEDSLKVKSQERQNGKGGVLREGNEPHTANSHHLESH